MRLNIPSLLILIVSMSTTSREPRLDTAGRYHRLMVCLAADCSQPCLVFGHLLPIDFRLIRLKPLYIIRRYRMIDHPDKFSIMCWAF